MGFQMGSTSIYKSGDDKDYSSHCPISILPSISKVLEKGYAQKTLQLYATQIITYIKANKDLGKKRSTNQAVLEFVSKVAQSFRFTY